MEMYNGILRCEGTNIVDQDGKQFFPIGFGVGGALYPEGYMWQVFGGPELTEKGCESPTYMYNAIVDLVGKEAADQFWTTYKKNWLTEKDIENMARWGANHIRLPLTYKTLMKDNEFIEEGFEEVERIVSWCRKNNLYVVLDLHAAPGGQNPWHFCDSDGIARLWEEPEKYWPLTIKLWKEIARRYADDPMILGYDLLNEVELPSGHTNAELRDLYVLIARAIREVDKNHILFIEGDKFAKDFTELEPFDDNMAYSYHLYKYNGPSPTKKDLQRYLELRYRWQIPLWNGETGDNNAKWWTDNIKLHRRHNIGICMWTHKKIHIPYQPYIIKLVPEYKVVADYIAGRGPKPDVEFAIKALMAQAEAMATKNCIFNPEFLEGFDHYEYDNKDALYLDTNAPIEKRVDDLVNRMTLEEKAGQLANSCDGIERLKLPAFRDGEVEHGVAVIGNNDPEVGVATVFPQAIAMAATFNEDLIYETANAISDEVRAKYSQGYMGLAFCSPVIDLARHPKWGRIQECFGEDPYLAGVLGAAFVKGLTGNHDKYLKTIAGPKHFTANSWEATRRDGNIKVDERSLWEYYLRPFEKCLELVDYKTIMPAYNGINGMPGAVNKWLLTSVLREMFGFDGYVLSDGAAIYDLYRAHHVVSSMEEAVALAVLAGCDVANGKGHREYVVEAVRQGLLTEDDVDIAVKRAMKARFYLGLLDPPENVPYYNVPAEVVASKKHEEIAKQVSLESIVLLNNKDILPINKNSVKKVALIGPYVRNEYLGTYSGIPPHVITLEKGLKDKLKDLSEVYCEPVMDGGFAAQIVPKQYFETPDGMEGLRAEFYRSRHLLGEPVHTTTVDNIFFDWRFRSPVPGIEGESPWSVRFIGSLTVPVTRKYRFSIKSDNGVRLIINGRVLVDEWGYKEPRTCSAEMYLEAGVKHTIVLERSSEGEGCHVALGWDYVDKDKLNTALNMAREADYAIVCVGTDKTVEDETTDKEYLGLPAHQAELVRQVFNANPNTIVVIFSGSPISDVWMSENIPAVLQVWYPGQEGGRAIADILFGDHSPSGRLPLTVYRSESDIPSIDCYNIADGGLTYQYFKGKPLYPFGYGLSYTEFAYSNLRTDKEVYSSADTIHITFDVENIGAMDGSEAAQVYIRVLDSDVKRPLKQLVAFKKVFIKKGETSNISLDILPEDLYRYDDNNKCRVIDSGRYEIMAGASSEDIRLTKVIKIEPFNK